MRRPTTTLRRLAPLLLSAVVLAGCGADGGGETADAAADVASEAGEMASDHDTDDMADAGASAAEDVATAAGDLAGLEATLPDGSTLSVAELAGEDLFVETFATWCSNCRQQLGDTQQAAAEAGDAARFLALSVESDLDPAELAAYQEEHGFGDVEFAVLTPASLAVLQETFGGAVLSPPSTPKFRVDADGTVSELTTGFESAEEILAQVGA